MLKMADFSPTHPDAPNVFFTGSFVRTSLSRRTLVRAGGGELSAEESFREEFNTLGCSKRPFSKAAASKGARRTLSRTSSVRAMRERS